MADAIPANSFKVDLRSIRFTLNEHFKVQKLFELPAFQHLTQEDCDAVLEQCQRFAREVTGPLNAPGDRAGCKLEGGKVTTPQGFQSAWKQLYELGFPTFAMEQEYGGFGGPRAYEVVIQEVLNGANPAFQMYPGLTHGAADVIAHFALPEDQERFLPHMVNGRFSGTMCLSEPHAGSDVGMARTKATPLAGNLYSISGTKCWISAGDHDLAENIVHLVLARIEGAPAGTKGLSLFIVPKIWVNEDGSLGEPNDVVTGSIEHKLGIRSSATAVLNFGENGKCRGILVGGQPHMGIKQMFRLMNGARISVGVQGIAVAAQAYLNALSYARERQQGSSAKNFKDPNAPRVAIIEHSDVRRMLMEMKSKVEGMRSLAVKLALHADMAAAHEKTDPGIAAFHSGQVDLLTPIVKAYCSDQAFRISELAIQTYGGAGFVMDHPVEQFARDAKIFSIYEGTNHIQAVDLVARKLQAHGGASLTTFLKSISDFVEDNALKPGLGAEVRDLGEALQALQQAVGVLMEYAMAGKIDQVTLVANAFLEAMAEVTIAHLLLEAAMIAEAAREADEEGDQSQEDYDFYSGRIMAAKFYVNFILPGVHSKLKVISSGDRSVLDMANGGFSTAV